MNHTCFPKEDHLPDWARRDNKVTKGDPVDKFCGNISGVGSEWYLFAPSKISALEIWSDTDDVSLFLISQFLSYIHMGLNLQHSYLQWVE